MSLSRYFAHSLLVLAALLVCAAAPAHADTVMLQTGFEADSIGSKPAGSIIGTGGTDTGGGFTTAGFAPFVTVPCGNRGGGFAGNCLFLGSPISTGSSITSVEMFAAGDYRLTFDYFFPSETIVSLGNFSQAITGPASAQTFDSGVFSLTAAAPLIFSTGDGGVVDLDNITLTRIEQTAPVPEPATVLLLGGGLAGVGAAVRKRRQKQG